METACGDGGKIISTQIAETVEDTVRTKIPPVTAGAWSWDRQPWSWRDPPSW